MQTILKRFLRLRSNQGILYNCENILELHTCVSFMSREIRAKSFLFNSAEFNKILVQHEIRRIF